MRSILILFHCESNTGYAIGRLEKVFFQMAMVLCGGDKTRIHFAYTSLKKGHPETLPADFRNVLEMDTNTGSPQAVGRICEYLKIHGIDTLFGFDQPVRRPMYSALRAAGIRHFISYWGAPISSIFSPLKRWMKRIEVATSRHGPDHYIFESQGMADTAVLGRGISPRQVHVAYLGVDTALFRPDPQDRDHVYEQFGIPRSRRIFFFSGHMEPRKGVMSIMQASRILAETRAADDWHVLLTGNQPGQENYLLDAIRGHAALDHVTFGGYRSDIERLHRGCYAGIIASTGWDSLTCSSLEMQASGLPLLLSDLPGLNEAIANGESGLMFPAGDYAALAALMARLLDDPGLQAHLAQGARARIERAFTQDIQVARLAGLLRELTAG